MLRSSPPLLGLRWLVTLPAPSSGGLRLRSAAVHIAFRRTFADQPTSSDGGSAPPPEAAHDASKQQPAPQTRWTVGEIYRGKPTMDYIVNPSSLSMETSEPVDSRSNEERFSEVLRQFFLPDGYPHSVAPAYMRYQRWQIAQSVVSSMMTALSTHALLVAVGVSAGAMPAAATVQWILKDGTGHIGKIVASNYGYRFDWDPKRYRMLAEVLWSCGILLEIATPAAPHYFLMIAMSANALKGVASVAAGATKVAINQRLSRRNNLADVTAKAESQSVCAHLIGLGLGIALFTGLGESVLASIAAYGMLTSFHLFANYKALRHVQLASLDPNRALAVIRGFQETGDPPTPDVLNASESFIFPSLSTDPRRKRIVLGSRFSVASQEGADIPFLLSTFKDERYLINFNRKTGCIHIVFHLHATLEDQLKSLLQASYIFQKEAEHRRQHHAATPKTDPPCGVPPPSRLARLMDWAFPSLTRPKRSKQEEEDAKYQQGLVEKEDVHRWILESLTYTRTNFARFKAAIDFHGWETKFLYAEVSSAYHKHVWIGRSIHPVVSADPPASSASPASPSGAATTG